MERQIQVSGGGSQFCEVRKGINLGCNRLLSNIIFTIISQEEMERCRNKMRIRLANIMIGLTAIGCAIMIYSGKQAAKRGESVTKMNLDWHKQFNESNPDAKAAPATK